MRYLVMFHIISCYQANFIIANPVLHGKVSIGLIEKHMKLSSNHLIT